MSKQKRKPSDYRELKEYLREKEQVTDIELDRRLTSDLEHTDLYVHCLTSKAGIDYWELHENFDVDVVSSWVDPTEDKISLSLRLRVEEEE